MSLLDTTDKPSGPLYGKNPYTVMPTVPPGVTMLPEQEVGGYRVYRGTALPVTALPTPATANSAESDPNGLSQHEPGAKLDLGKNQLGLVLGDFARALEQVGWIGTGGAIKYTPHGWLSVPDGEARYTDAMLRHMLKHLQGEKQDPSTKLLHLAHMAWNSLAILELELRKQ